MSSPSGGRPSCRQASGGRCIWPSGQILGTPHRANGSAKSRIRASLAAKPTVDTDSRIGSRTCSASSMCSIGLTKIKRFSGELWNCLSSSCTTVQSVESSLSHSIAPALLAARIL